MHPAPSCTETDFGNGAAVVVGAAVVAGGEVERAVVTATAPDVTIGMLDSTTEDSGTDELTPTIELVAASIALMGTATDVLVATS